MRLKRFTARELPEKNRATVMRELYEAIERVDVEPLGGKPLFAESTLRLLPGMAIVEAACSPCVARRTVAHVADGKDDLVLSITTGGVITFRPKDGEEQVFRPGEAYLGFNDRPSEQRLLGEPAFVDIAIPRVVLVPRLADLDRAARRKLPPTAELRLLTGYARLLTREFDDMPPEMEACCADHLLDLAIMVLGGVDDAVETARGRGMRAARLKALKADIAANATRPELSIETMARRHDISPQYIRALFNSAGTTFGDVVLNERLAHAYRALTDPRGAVRRISAIAFDAGFGDLSYFNRAFRRRYGMTPSDLRAEQNAAIHLVESCYG